MLVVVDLLKLLSLLMIAEEVVSESCAEKHLKKIASKTTPGDNGFFLHIIGGPTTYKPQATYTLRIEGEKYQFSQKYFKRFLLSASAESPARETDSGAGGTFQLFGDIHTRFSDHCTNTVMETSQTLDKEEVQVLWTAPAPGSGCINFQAAVMEIGDVWSSDNRLRLRLCDESLEEEDVNIIQEECCACQEAKYEIMLEGLWSKETHPRDFPTSEWLLHFSDVIGASHDFNYRVWQPGGVASKGLTEVAKWGSPRVLESELKAESRHIRTIIKARGLWYPNVNGKTFAIFRTDSRHHLVSVVSMLGPSPDWIVGVSALEMCLTNCTWLDHKELYLYPWDAGVDDGVSYESPDQPSQPNKPIKRITTQDPMDENNPFYKPDGGPMKPLAKLVIKKLREYKKSCTDPEAPVEFRDQISVTEGAHQLAGCETGPWSDWTGCSVTCGKGINMRTRDYLDRDTARDNGCDLQLAQRELCSAPVSRCGTSGANFYVTPPPSWVPDDTCSTTEWSDWSPCSALCGTGWRARTRRFFNRLGRKKCPHIDTVSKESCQGEQENCDQVSQEIIPAECPVTDWSNWSPCSQSCGSGLHVRTRLYRVSKEEQLAAGCEVQLLEKGGCVGHSPRCDSGRGLVCSQEKEVGPCRGTFKRWYYDNHTKQCREFYFGGCRGNSNNFIKYEDCDRRCQQRDDRKRSQPSDIFLNDQFRNALDVLVKKRKKDTANNMNDAFIEIEEQKAVVQKLEMEKKAAMEAGRGFEEGKLQAAVKKLMMMEKHRMMDKQMMVFKQKQRMMALKRMETGQLKERMPRFEANNVTGTADQDTDCLVTSWSPWSLSCSSTCGSGYRSRFRTVTRPSQGSGRSCPSRLEKQRRCRLPACPRVSCHWSDWGPCSATCGSSGFQTRERQSGVSSSPCPERGVERRVCLLPCCLIIDGVCQD